jgi:hypothetical protein
MNEAIQVIDFSEEEVIRDITGVGLASKGAIKLSDLREMTLKDYDTVIERSNDIIKKLYGGDSNG